MADTITCPKCKTKIEVTKALSAQLSDKVRAEIDAETQDERLALKQQADEFSAQQARLNQELISADEQVAKRVAEMQDTLTADARQKAAADVEIELQDRDAQLREAKEKLRKAQEQELELRKKERDLQTRIEETDLTIERQLNTERDKVRNDTRRQADEEHQMKEAERTKIISDLNKQIDDMKRKAEQGSQQLQGEVQELALETILEQTFPLDIIEEVGKGIAGGDVIQRVRNSAGLDCGTILWESKRTKLWSNAWLPKLRQDQRNAKAEVSILVTTALPEGTQHFDQIEGVWVCSWICAINVAHMLRVGLLQVAKAKQASKGQAGKKENAYAYLSSAEFRNRVSGIVEAFATMQKELDQEQRAIKRQWAKREQQLGLALSSTAGMYGDLQGIIGNALPEIESMTMPQLEAGS